MRDPFSPPPKAYPFVGRLDSLGTLERILLGSDVYPAVVICGSPGVGKSALIRRFSHLHQDRFPGGVTYLPVLGQELPRVSEMMISQGRRALLILDDADEARQPELTRFLEEARDWPEARVVMTARRLSSDIGQIPVLELRGLNLDEVVELGRVGGLSEEAIKLALAATGRHPLAARLMIEHVLAGGSSELFDQLEMAGLPTILGPDGRPIGDREDGLQQVELTALGVSDVVIRTLAEDPDRIYSLSPRRFEELIADLYAREGYDVELTPVSNDGGVDIYAVQRTPFGSFLTVIDCKRFRKDRPVEVGLVRQLYGTVEAQDASVGVLATTSYFSKGAVAFQEERKYRLGLQNFLSIQEMLHRQMP